MSDQIEATGKHVSSIAEGTAAQVREQAESLRAGIIAAQPVAKAKLNKTTAKAKKKALKVQQQASKRGHELGEEAAALGKKAARQASKEAQKRRAAAVAGAPVVAAAARKKGEHVLEVAKGKGGEALLSALDTDAGKRIAATQAGAALKSKLTARKRRRRKMLLLVILNAGGAAAFRQLRARRAASEAPTSGPLESAPPATLPPTDTVVPGSTGTAAGDPLAGIVEEAVDETAQVADETEAPATVAGADGELHQEGESS